MATISNDIGSLPFSHVNDRIMASITIIKLNILLVPIMTFWLKLIPMCKL